MTWDVLEYHNCEVHSCNKTEIIKCNKGKRGGNRLIFLLVLAQVNNTFHKDRLLAQHQIFQAYHTYLKKLHL